MTYEYEIVVEFDSAYFERGNTVKDAMTAYGRNGWQLAAVVPLEDNRGYAIIFQREL